MLRAAFIALVATGFAAGTSWGQSAKQANSTIAIDFPAEGIELKTLADIVTKRLKIPILYDENILNKRVVIRVPVDVEENALMGVLQSALRMKQMALVDADQPGWKQIVPAANIAAVARPAIEGQIIEPGMAVTQVFSLQQGDPARVAESIRPLLTTPGGNVQALAAQKAIIVSDYGAVLARVGAMVKLLDAAESAMEVKFLPLKNAEAVTIVPALTQLIATRDQQQFGGTGTSGIVLSADERSNQVVIVAPSARMKDVAALIVGMDKPLELKTKVYRLRNIAPERIDKLIKNMIGADAKRQYQGTVDAESGSLVVAATPEVLARLDAIVKEMDSPPDPQAQSPIRFYKLKNTKAADVLATLTSLMAEPKENGKGEEDAAPAEAPRRAMTMQPQAPGTVPPPDASGVNTTMDKSGTSRLPPHAAQALGGRRAGSSAPVAGVRAANLTVTADVNTNSIIVIAPPAMQQLYADLIEQLDVRRPQVQIECTIVTLDTTDGFQFGVDVGSNAEFGNNKIISFSSFGVSVVDPATGGLTPQRGRGGTFALLSPSVADVVLRALASNSRSRLMSSPQLLVNDNGKGKLQSVAQEPYAEILDTSTNQSRTGLGGLAQAGTTIEVEPHISDADYLQLTYSIELSSFTGTGSAGLPPPSQKNSVDSTVTIPDGHTIVVGGLTVRNQRADEESIPGINQVPLLKDVFGTRSKTSRQSTLFVFMRPVILRDDKFEDLKYLSEKKSTEAGIAGSYPRSEPVPMR